MRRELVRLYVVMVEGTIWSRGGLKLGVLLTGYLGVGYHGDLIGGLYCEGALQGDRGGGRRWGVFGRRARVAKLIVHIPVLETAVVGKSREIVECSPQCLHL